MIGTLPQGCQSTDNSRNTKEERTAIEKAERCVQDALSASHQAIEFFDYDQTARYMGCGMFAILGTVNLKDNGKIIKQNYFCKLQYIQGKHFYSKNLWLPMVLQIDEQTYIPKG